MLAKRELEVGPLVSYDPDLYAPLFRNVSIFKRSVIFNQFLCFIKENLLVESQEKKNVKHVLTFYT